LIEGGAKFGSPLIVRFVAAREADYAKRVRQCFFHEQVVKRGNELARGEIAARPKDDDRAWIDDFAGFAEAASHQLVELLGFFVIHVAPVSSGRIVGRPQKKARKMAASARNQWPALGERRFP
jgi:hypothetical protein